MSPTNLSFWSISRKESLEFQQKHALRKRFLRTLLCLIIIFNPEYNRKTLIRKRTPILEGTFIILNSCFIQYNGPLVENVNLAQEVNALSKKLFVFNQFQIHFSIVAIRVVSIAVCNNVHLVCISLKFDAYFSSTIVSCPF